MATRIKDWIIPYTGGIGIEITEDHIINVLLRAMNNLIHYTWEDDPEYDGPKELYVDLQLPDWITPEDDFPVWVTVWEILEEDWWQQSGTILNWKTTSWDWVRIIYANDDTLYYDPWTWVWIPFLTWDKLDVATASKLWVIKLWSDTKQTEPAQNPSSVEGRTYPVQLNASNQAMVNVPWKDTTYESLIEEQWWTDESLVTTGEKYIWNHKQDQLTAWQNITIDQNNVISATISAMTFKWSVADYSSLPTTWQSVWDVWVTEDTGIAYCWDGTDWVSLGSFIDLSNYFNKTVDDSDDIVQWTLNLFVSPAEKATWNNKQDKLIAWRNITINADWRTINAVDTTYTEWDWINITNNNVIENTLPFNPENEGSLGQTLKRTSTWYRWADAITWVRSVNWRTGDVIVDEFDPENAGSNGQVLKKTDNWYRWSNESVTSVNGRFGNVIVNEFNPWNSGTAWLYLKRTSSWYIWAEAPGGWWGWWWDSNVKMFYIEDENDLTSAQAALDWLNSWNMSILKYHGTFGYQPEEWDYFFYPVIDSTSAVTRLIFEIIPTTNQDWIHTDWYTVRRHISIEFTLDWSTVQSISISEKSASRDDYLSTTVDYGTVIWQTYQPLYPWSPATKKYVDDKFNNYAPVNITYWASINVDMNQSLNYTLTLTWDCNLTFSNFTPGKVYQILVKQDSNGWHRIYLPSWFKYASWYSQDTTANSVSKLIIDSIDWHYFASITRYS